MTFAARVKTALHTARHEATWQQWVLIAIALGSAVAMRQALAPNFTDDYTYAMKGWIEQIRAGGFASLSGLSDYNPPFLYLLYIGTLLPIEHDLSIIKLIAYGFDLFLAAGVAALVFRMRGSVIVAAIAGVGTLFVPEVFINSGIWGQVDSTFTAFLVWAMFFLVGRQDVPAWVFFALAFAFKLQAVFLLPWMAVAFIVQKHRWRAVALAIVAFGVTYIPALVAGRTVESLARIYLNQSKSQTLLAPGVTNMYQWVPQRFEETVGSAGLLFGLGIVALLSVVYLRRAALLSRPELWLLQVATAYAVVVPFILPHMHDRYFYTGGVLAVVCVLLDRRYLVPALLLQLTAFCAYSPFMFGLVLIPHALAAIIQLIAVVWIVALSLGRMRTTVSPLFPARTPVASADRLE